MNDARLGRLTGGVLILTPSSSPAGGDHDL